MLAQVRLLMALALGAALAATALHSIAADAAALPGGTVVRVEGTGIEAGWFTGKILVAGERCTMVKLDKPTKDGYTMVALVALKRLQRQQGTQWTDVALPPLVQREPKACLEGSD